MSDSNRAIRIGVLTRSRRRGTAYLVVFGMVSIVLVAALGAAMTARLDIRSVGQTSDALRAEVLAESAVSWAIMRLSADANWRTTYTNNVETATVSVGGGTISFKLVDEIDANLSNKTTQPVRLYGIGRVGAAAKVLSVQLEGSNPLTCLRSAMSVGGNITLDKTVLTAPLQNISGNGNFNGGNSFSAVNGNLLISGTITPNGCPINGTQSAAAPARTMPETSVFDYYVANGTEIPYSSLSGGKISRKVISPSSSGFLLIGSNPKGIYVIDCGGQDIEVTESRIIGTLVILNPGSGSRIGSENGNGGVNWVPAMTGMPALLVKGNMCISFGQAANPTLSEPSASTNFNPSNAAYPYPGGTTDSDETDSYPAVIDGLIYVSGNLTDASGVPQFPSMANLVIGGAFTATHDTLKISHRAIYSAMPPPGFTGDGALRPVPGSWRWEAAQ